MNAGFTVGILGAAIGIHWSLGLSAVALCLGTLAAGVYALRGRPADADAPRPPVVSDSTTAWAGQGARRVACEGPRSVSAARRRPVSARSRPERRQARAACSSAAKPPATASASTWR